MVGDSDSECRSRPCKFRGCKKEIPLPTSIDSLPDELLFSILVCLPADYLHDRARLVCRRWYLIIHSHSFIDAHHQRSTYCLLSYYRYEAVGRPIWMMTATPQGLIQTKECNFIFRGKFKATCNGLVLEMLSCQKNIIILQIINPTTKKAFLLPPFTAPVGTNKYNISCGIAYAAASMEYKVAISYYHRSPLSSGLVLLSVGVDNSWRQVGVADQYLSSNSPLLTEGFMHWVVQSRGKKILTLDVETEILTVSEVSCPSQNHIYNNKFYLSTGRSLSLLIGRGEDRRFFELWEMNPETKEWMKLKDDIKLGDQQQQLRLQQLGISPGEHMKPRGWLKYPEVLIFYVKNTKRPRIHHSISVDIVSYNLDTHEITSTELPWLCYTQALYRNTLLWLT